MNRNQRLEAARHTLQVLEAGTYAPPGSGTVSIRGELDACLSATSLHWPEDIARLRDEQRGREARGDSARIEVVNETTLRGIARLLDDGVAAVAALNFASARNPGGGFQSGSQAQEESLARSSGLFASLMQAWPYYEHHRREASLLYSDAIIWSPQCPVFREDDGTLLGRPRLASFITCAAPNAGAVHANQPGDAPLIEPTLRRRAEGVLALAAERGVRGLVLGAWGCGVFRNDPAMVADAFRELLLGTAGWSRHFERVVFSVHDGSPALGVLRAFEAAFAGVQ